MPQTIYPCRRHTHLIMFYVSSMCVPRIFMNNIMNAFLFIMLCMLLMYKFLYFQGM